MRRAPNHGGRWTAVLLGCVLGAGAWAASWAQSGPANRSQTAPRPGQTAQTRRTLIASGEAPDLFLLYTGDVIGYLDPCG